MALVRRSPDRYSSTESRSSVTRSSKSVSSSSKTYSHYEAKSAADLNNNSAKASHIEVASNSRSNNFSKNRSSIPVRQGSASPPKPLPPSKGEEPKRRVVEDRNLEAEDSEATPKVQRKVKKRLGRKPKRRNNAVVGQDIASRRGKEQSSESEEEFFGGNSNEVRAPRVLVTNQRPVTTVTRPFKITYRTPTSTDDDSSKHRRSREERPKTLPIFCTVKPNTVDDKTRQVKDSGEDTLTSGEESERIEQRTSIRIVSSSARSSDTEGSARKLQIEAKSFKRKARKDERHVSEQESRLARASSVYTQKTRNIITRDARQDTRKVEQVKLQRIQLQEGKSTPDYPQTLPRNFKTVRVPIQEQPSPQEKETSNQRRRFSQPINSKSQFQFPEQSEDLVGIQKFQPVNSRKPHDLSPTGHQCRRGCTHVVDDTVDGPRIIRRSRENRRKSNPNQILGRTEIQELRKGRPKSEISRSASLPRSSERPRIKSTAFEELVETNDLGNFSRSKSRTLPYRKKRVTYHEGVKDDFHAFSESEAQSGDFERHLLIHQHFTENAQKHLKAVTDTQVVHSNLEDWARESEETQERAKEIQRKSREQIAQASLVDVQGLRETEEREVEAAKSFKGVYQTSQNYTAESSAFQKAEVKGSESQETRGHVSNYPNQKGEKGGITRNSHNWKEEKNQYIEEKSQNEKRIENKTREFVKEEVIEEHIKARRLSQQKEQERREAKAVKRSQTLPRNASKEVYQDQKQQDFEEFIRNQRNILLNQLHQREDAQKPKAKGHGSNKQGIKSPKGSKHQEVKGQEIVPQKADTENSGRSIEEFLVFPEASKNKRRYKSANDANSIQEAKTLHQNLQSKDQRYQQSVTKVQRSQSSAEKNSEVSEHSYKKAQFLLQNNEEAKALEKNSVSREDIIRVFSRGGVIQLSMESADRDRFEQRQREYEALQKRRSLHKQEQREINEERYRYINNEYDETKSNGYYYNQQRYDPGNRNFRTYYSNSNFAENDDVFEEQMDTNSTKITQLKEDQMKGRLDKVHYTICTHYFYPEDHELIVNLHRLGKIEVPRGLSHRDTCIFYNHLYVYENEEVFAETLAPIMPTIKAEVINLDEQPPEDETMSEHSSANLSYNDDASSQYSSSSRRERNLYSSLKAQKYYDSKRNNNNNEDSVDFGFDSTYETLRRKRKSYNEDDDMNRQGAISPGSSSGKSDFTYSKPRLLRRSEHFPGVGREVEDDYPRWTPKSPTTRERDYGLSVALPP